MVLSQRARMALGACCAVLLAGILGLAWWWRHRQVVAEKVATWAETGIGILYSQADGSMTMGDVVLKPDFAMSRESLKALVQHEAAHRTQWAVGTAIGGPAAFPIAYGVTYSSSPARATPSSAWRAWNPADTPLRAPGQC